MPLIVDFSTTLTLQHFTQWYFTQHPYWSESSVGSLFQDLDNQLICCLTALKIIDCPHILIWNFLVWFVLFHTFFWEIFQKITHPITTPNQARLTMEFLSDKLLKSRCILLVYVVPINFFKSFLTVQSHTCITSRCLLFWCDSFRVLHAHKLPPGLSSNHTVLGETSALMPFVTPLIVNF